jgi:hypothetical protein
MCVTVVKRKQITHCVSIEYFHFKIIRGKPGTDRKFRLGARLKLMTAHNHDDIL